MLNIKRSRVTPRRRVVRINHGATGEVWSPLAFRPTTGIDCENNGAPLPARIAPWKTAVEDDGDSEEAILEAAWPVPVLALSDRRPRSDSREDAPAPLVDETPALSADVAAMEQPDRDSARREQARLIVLRSDLKWVQTNGQRCLLNCELDFFVGMIKLSQKKQSSNQKIFFLRSSSVVI